MRLHRPLACLCFAFFATINPGYLTGCGSESDDPEFDFTEMDLSELLEDLSEEGARPYQGVMGSYQIELQVELKGMPLALLPSAEDGPDLFGAAKAYACGTKERMFGSTASACDTQYVTTAAIAGTLSVFEERGGTLHPIVEDVTLEGDLMVFGLSLYGATLYIQTDDGIELELSHAYDSDMVTVRGLRGLDDVN